MPSLSEKICRRIIVGTRAQLKTQALRAKDTVSGRAFPWIYDCVAERIRLSLHEVRSTAVLKLRQMRFLALN